MTLSGAHAKRLLHWLGSGLAVTGTAFVVFKLAEYREQLDLARLGVADWFVFSMLVLVCALSGVLLAFAWRALLQRHGVSLSVTSAVRIYGVSQIAKYVPSNVVHLIGRQALASAEGLPAWPVVKSTLWELGCLPYAALLCAPLVLPLLDRGISPVIGIALFVVALTLGIAAAAKLVGTAVARAVALQVAYLLFAGAQFLIVLLLLSPDAAMAAFALAVCGASVLAWAAGFLTPGAPAGVGVREVVLYMLLSPLVSQPDLLAAVMLARMVSVCSDVLFYFGALSLSTQSRPSAEVSALAPRKGERGAP